MPLTVHQYHRMIDAGILTSDDRVELLNGLLVQKMPKSPGHSATTYLARTALEQNAPSGWFASSESPVTLPASEPEPDAGLIRGQPRDYLQRHPWPADVALLVEVADSSPLKDRQVKTEIYAEAKIPCYWIVNLRDRQVEVHSGPSGPAPHPQYARRDVYGESDDVPLVVDGIEVARIPVQALLP